MKPAAVPLTWKVVVTRELPALLAHATDDDDPGLWAGVYAEQVRKRLPPETFAQIEQAAAASDFVDTTWARAAQEFPQVVPHEKWLREFLTAAQGELAPETPEEQGTG